MEEPLDDEQEARRHAVLNVFGLTLEVSNPRLAELLTMDAKEALTADIRDVLSRDDEISSEPEVVLEDVLVRPEKTRSTREEERRKEFRARTSAIGQALGFDVRSDGSWSSPADITIITRPIERPVTFAAASHFVRELQAVLASGDASEDCSLLFVVADRDSVDVLKVAIRQAHAHESMRVASIEDMQMLADLVTNGPLTHAQALVFVAPVAAVDVGEMLAVLRAALHGSTDDSHA